MNIPDLESWVSLQSNMRVLQKADGWDQFRAAVEQKIQETFEAMLQDGPAAHDKYAGFVEGLRWVLAYPQFLVDQVERLQRQP